MKPGFHTLTLPAVYALMVGATILFWESGGGVEYVWIYRFILLAILMLVPFLVTLGKQHIVGILEAVVLGYFVLHAFLFSSIPQLTPDVTALLTMPGIIDTANSVRKVEQGLRLTSALSLGYIFIAVFFMMSFTRKRYALFIEVLQGLAVLLAVGVFFSTDPYREIYFLHNPSIAGTFMAVMCAGMNSWSLLLFLPALLMTKAVTPLICLSAALVIRAGKVGLLSLPLATAGLYFGYGKLATGNGRFPVWRMTWDWAAHHFAPSAMWIGSGLASAPVLTPLIQLHNGESPLSTGYFFYLHNDWLQILVETGVVGLVLAVLFYLRVLWKVRVDARALSMLTAFSVAMLTNFPLHCPLLALTGMVLIGGAYARK